jgi:hypothetical protein
MQPLAGKIAVRLATDPNMPRDSAFSRHRASRPAALNEIIASIGGYH